MHEPARLTTVTRTAGNNAALKDGRVRPEGLALDFVEVPVLIDAFRRMVRGLEFDVCEMALTTTLCALAHGKRLVPLPIPLVRAFHHGAILVNREAGICTPRDLEGRRVGVNRGWTVTTGLWARRVLQHEHGVDLSRITWVLSGDEHVAEWQRPPNVVPVEPGRSVAQMLQTGELAAAIGVDSDAPNVGPLIDDAAEAGLRAFAQRGDYPINHVVVVKAEVLERRPDIAPRLFDAFARAKQRYVQQLRDGPLPGETAVDRVHRRVMALSGGDDPLPYGVAPNRAMFEAAIAAAVDQRIIERAPALESLFPENTLALVG